MGRKPINEVPRIVTICSGWPEQVFDCRDCLRDSERHSRELLKIRVRPVATLQRPKVA